MLMVGILVLVHVYSDADFGRALALDRRKSDWERKKDCPPVSMIVLTLQKLLGCIRAIYLPVSHSASKDHPNLCSFVQINFALDRTLKVWRGDDKFDDYPTKKLEGLGVSNGLTLGLDVTGLILLSMPPPPTPS